MIQMVEDRADLPNAIALNSSLVNVTRLIGPSVAGILILWVGEGMCFLLNGISYLAVIWALCAMRIKPIPKHGNGTTNVLLNLKEGVQYTMGFASMRAIVLLLAAVSLFGSSYMVLMPVFAKDIFHGGPAVLGLLMGAIGFGALGGAIFLATRKTVLGLGRWLMYSSCLFGTGLILFSLLNNLTLALPFLALCGFGMMVELAGSNTILQTIVDEDKRGRVMSLYTVAFMGMTPIGGLLAGSLASRIGSPCTVLLCGALTLVCALVFGTQLPCLRREMRHVIEKGVIGV
jgi:MFS family permease